MRLEKSGKCKKNSRNLGILRRNILCALLWFQNCLAREVVLTGIIPIRLGPLTIGKTSKGLATLLRAEEGAALISETTEVIQGR